MKIGNNKVSIIMSHYSEDERRDNIAKKCIEAIQPYRNENVEFILVCNGFYNGLKEYADKYFERPADSSSGRSSNIGFKAAEGDILVFLCNDVLVSGNWLEESKEIVLKYEKYLATPCYYEGRKWHELPPVDGYCVNQRVGSDMLVMRRDQYEDIGACDEVNPIYDGSNYLNRWIKKGYAVMMTKTPLATNIGRGHHCYTKQQAEMGYHK